MRQRPSDEISLSILYSFFGGVSLSTATLVLTQDGSMYGIVGPPRTFRKKKIYAMISLSDQVI